jgi:probable HAF family extracellular repeat protein
MPIRPLRLAALLTLLAPLATPAVPLYRITDLGTLGGSASQAGAINDNGDVVGASTTAGDTDIRAFLYSNGVMEPLGTLGGDTFANAINNARLIVGDSQISPGGDFHGYYFNAAAQGEGLHDVGTLDGPASVLLGVNATGDMVGVSDKLIPTPQGGTTQRAILYRNGQMTDLGTFGGDFAGATAINDKGQIVGFAAFPPPPDPGQSVRNHAFIYENGQMRSLGTLPGDTHSEAYAINENSQVVGVSSTVFGTTHAFLYDTDGVMKPLGSLVAGHSTFAAGINDAGVIVGDAFVDQTLTTAFVWENGEIHDLNSLIDPDDSPWYLLSATAINNSGVIVGVGIINDQEHAYMAVPIPEPTTLFPAVAALTILRRRRPRGRTPTELVPLVSGYTGNLPAPAPRLSSLSDYP